MIDPDNPKESILEELLWTEKEFKEIVRQAITKVTTKMTFDPYAEQLDSRKLVLLAIMMCPGPNQPEVFSAIRTNLDGLRIAMMYSNNSNESMMKIAFEVPRFHPFQS